MTAGGSAGGAGGDARGESSTGPAAWRWPRSTPPILVVEDDESVREMLVDALEDAGHPVVAASNGAAALELVRSHRPSLILLDLTMPVMDGRAFLDAYRRLSGPHAPVVVCTAHPQPVVVAAQLGADDYLRKPFAPDDVLAVAGAHADALATATDRQRATG